MRFRRLFNKRRQTSPPQTVSEIHWREGKTAPRQDDAMSQPPLSARQEGPKHPPIYHAPAQKAQTVSEIHWRQGDGKQP